MITVRFACRVLSGGIKPNYRSSHETVPELLLLCSSMIWKEELILIPVQEFDSSSPFSIQQQESIDAYSDSSDVTLSIFNIFNP
ncbi:Siderophore iron transporter [Dirofilaria immitis]